MPEDKMKYISYLILNQVKDDYGDLDAESFNMFYKSIYFRFRRILRMADNEKWED